MAGMKSILVNEKQYKVQMLSVLDSLDLHLDVMTSLGGFLGKIALLWTDLQNGKTLGKDEVTSLFDGVSPEGLKILKKRVFSQVITPENKFLGDEATIEQWFSQEGNKQDVWEVLVKATIELLGEYAPGFLRDMAKNGLEKAKAEQLKSQNTTEKSQSSTTP